MEKIQQQYQKEIAEMVFASNRIANKGYVTSHGGNVSYRVDENVVLITPTKLNKGDIKFDDIVIINLQGKVLFATNNRKPTGEMPFHVHVLNKRPDLKSLVHAHPPIITGFAINHSKLLERPFLPEPIIEVGPVLSVIYEEPLSQELADAFEPVLLCSNAFLMQNHGILIGSNDRICRTVELLEMMEAAALSILTASMLGDLKEISEKGIRKLDTVLKIRNLPLPGAPGVNSSLADLY